MAFYEVRVAGDNVGGEPEPTSALVDVSVPAPDILFRVVVNTLAPPAGDDFYIEYAGSFTYPVPIGDLAADFTPSGGTITSITAYPGNPYATGVFVPVPFDGYQAQFQAGFDETFDFATLASLEGADFYAYLLRHDDSVLGSDFNDKLSGYAGDDSVFLGAGNDQGWGGKGNDFLSGGPGKDKLFGQGGKDKFLYEEGDGKDTLMDFKKNKDSLIIDRDLVKSISKLEKISKDKKGNMVSKFGDGDVLKIKNFSTDDLQKTTIAFLDFDQLLF